MLERVKIDHYTQEPAVRERGGPSVLISVLKKNDPSYSPGISREVDYPAVFNEGFGDVLSKYQFSPSDIKISDLNSTYLKDPNTRYASKFRRLMEQWKIETTFASSVLEMVTNPVYQQIIGMGREAIPHIVKELSRQPDHWFWALKAITGEDPVQEKDRGDLSKMTGAWLLWAARNGYNV